VQDGLITRAQALATGLSVSAIRHALRPGGPWQRVVGGVYATFAGPLADVHRLRAALLACGERSMVTGAWACWMHGLRYGPPRDTEIDVLVPARLDRGAVAFVRPVRTVRLPQPTYWRAEAVDGDRFIPFWEVLDEMAPTAHPGRIPMAPAARAVVDTVTRPDRLPSDWRAGCAQPGGCPRCWRGESHQALALRNVRALLCEVVQRGQTDVAELRREVEAGPRRGSALARGVVAEIGAGCRSAPECELRDLMRTSSVLPEARYNQPLPGASDIIPDGCLPEARLVLEVDSKTFHGFGDAPAKTERRRARLAALGWRVLPISPTRLRKDATNVLREIEAAYLAGLRDRPRNG
jgi:very-short-patch-repair endonuclease